MLYYNIKIIFAFIANCLTKTKHFETKLNFSTNSTEHIFPDELLLIYEKRR